MNLKKVVSMLLTAGVLSASSGCLPETAEQQAAREKLELQQNLQREKKQQEAQAKAEEEQKAVVSGRKTGVMAGYVLDSDVKVSEIRSENNPGVTTVIVSGDAAAVAVVSFKSEQKGVLGYKLLSKFNVAGANVYDILRRDTLVLTVDAAEKLTERLAA